MSEKKNNKRLGIVAGPILVGLTLMALWNNETRFDYHRAAAATIPVDSPAEVIENEVFSYTGPMDPQLTFPGEYIETLTGYLTVWRTAEIYCWDEDRDDDGSTWTMRWMNRVESNSRNKNLRQKLSSTQFILREYSVGDLTIERAGIEFIDSVESISPKKLTLSSQGTDTGLRASEEYLHLLKNRGQNLGDERMSYSGIPVPNPATYFGKFRSGRAVADTSHQRTGFISSLIRDSGILHHIVGGERTVALAKMKAHIKRLKWMVRGAGTVAVVVGFYYLFEGMFGFLFHVPILGPIAETGSVAVALVVGLPLALFTIAGSYLVAHPFLMVVILAVLVGWILRMRKRGLSSQQALKSELDEEHGHVLDLSELEELEFIELAQLTMADSVQGVAEEEFLLDWSKKRGWDRNKYDQMIARARTTNESTTKSTDEHVHTLIRLSMADGDLSPREVRAIRGVSKRAGYDDQAIKGLIQTVRRGIKPVAVT